MKKILLLLVNLVFLDQIYAQNLVPNPSFELHDTCISSLAIFFGHIVKWDSPSNGTPDCFNTCDFSVPSNTAGYQYPHTGNAYAGSAFYAFNGSNYYIEYLQVKLDTPMVEQQTYCASFYINHANRGYDLALKNIGMYFSDTHISVPTTSNLNFIPQITEPNYISDDSIWTLVYGQYTSHGGEKYLIIGNFKSDSTSDTLHLTNSYLPPMGGVAYYYIDDVNVHCCTCDSTTSLHAGVGEIEKTSQYKLYPNPSIGNMVLEYDLKNSDVALFTIYSMDGRLVKEQTLNPSVNAVSITATELNAGIYYYEVKEGNRKAKAEKLVIIK